MVCTQTSRLKSVSSCASAEEVKSLDVVKAGRVALRSPIASVGQQRDAAEPSLNRYRSESGGYRRNGSIRDNQAVRPKLQINTAYPAVCPSNAGLMSGTQDTFTTRWLEKYT